LDLAPAKLRVKRGGGTAGHNGLRDIQRALGSADFGRVRLGIGHPGDKARVTGHVLGNFAKDELWVGPMLDAVADAAPLLAEGREADFMTRVALLTQEA
jgi:PTH1 family peptidyl-tRNA hydrolase